MTVSLEEARDLANRGFGSVETEIWAPNPEQPGYLFKVRTRTVGEVCDEIREILGEYPVGGEEYISVFDRYTCHTPGCGHLRYDGTGRVQFHGHAGDGWADGGACRHIGCKCAKFVGTRDREWPKGRIVVFSVRGGSEGDYVHLSVIREDNQQEDLIMLAKTFQGRDAAWQFARNVADLLGV